MKLPHADRAIIPAQKLRDYLLSTEHPVGRFKAVFFRRLSYTEETWSRLEEDVRAQHLRSDAEEVGTTMYGRKFLIRAPLKGPSAESALVATLWIIREGDEVPRFLTAYPGGES